MMETRTDGSGTGVSLGPPVQAKGMNAAITSNTRQYSGSGSYYANEASDDDDDDDDANAIQLCVLSYQ